MTSRIVINGGTTYYFRGWSGAGNGSYTSPDSTGIDSVVSIFITAPIVETARWTTTVGIINISSVIPSTYDLFQNYPNPFNPVTKIKFDIPQSNGQIKNTKLVIYDALGKEILTIVNERLAPGSYEADFNAGDFPSGLYFYRIVSGEFSKIKKMILVK
ncbi:MAG: T9SS type A sorting domain-containing protein [Ignavibacteria bacterium]